jgi:hypothetical protein
MAAHIICTSQLGDDELRAHLERRDTLLFRGLGREWQQIEKQVERLGFGDLYVVSQRGSRTGDTKVGLLRG